MKDIDALLIQYNISPAHLSHADKQNFAVWLKQAETDGDEFQNFAKIAHSHLLGMKNVLLDYANKMEQLLAEAGQPIEKFLGAPAPESLVLPPRQKRTEFTQRHLDFLQIIGGIREKTYRYLSDIQKKLEQIRVLTSLLSIYDRNYVTVYRTSENRQTNSASSLFQASDRR